MQYTINFDKLNNSHIKQVGGKNASLGEMFHNLRVKGIQVPDGFATTADASELVSAVFSEQDPQAKEMIAMAIKKARKAGKKIGLCGQGPSDFPEFARFLVQQRIDSISFNPDALIKGIENILKAEKKPERRKKRR